MLKTEMLRVITLMMKCRFPTHSSIISILRKRYGENLVKSISKLEKLDFKHKKAQLDLEFLQTCKKNNVIPIFLRFKLGNSQLSSSHAYNICQKRLLKEEISNKRKLVRTLAFNLTSLKNDLKCVLNIIDFVHITTVFLTSNNKNILKVRKAHGKKISKLCSDNCYYESVTSHDPEKVLFNFSNHSLTEHEKSLLSRGLNFAIPPKNVNYADYLLPFELLFRDIDLCEIASYDKEFIRSKLRDCVITSFRDSGKINENNLSKKEHLALKNLIKNRDLIIQKADKGNSCYFK